MTGSVAHALFPDDDDRRRQEKSNEKLVQFIRAHEGQIKHFLQRVCDDPGLVEDAFQEALVVTYARWDVVSQLDQPLFWVRRAAWYKLQGLLRGRRREVVGLDEIEPASLTEPSSAWEAEVTLRELLRRLPTRPRAVLALAADGYQDEEICQQLGLALTTVRTYKSAARKRLKELAEEAGYDAATRMRP
jgi:RNA polymerase sigma factor (sigma-70 family)